MPEPAYQTPVALAVPCYNERARLQVGTLETAAREHDLRVLFVDDGSLDGTGDLIVREIAEKPHLGLLRLPANRGKAAAVRLGMLAIEEKWPEAEWLGFWDADLSSPLGEVVRMLRFHDLEGGGYDAIWASRVMRAGSTVHRKFKRHLFGRLFATVCGSVLGVRAYDTQCGAKLFRKVVVPRIFADEFISRWIFDVEIYCRLGHDRILEYPVKEWRDVPGSKVRIWAEFGRIARDILAVSRKYR